MKLWSRIMSALHNLFHKRQVESQLDEEVRAYVDMVTDERIAAGILPPKPAAPRWQSSEVSSK